MVSVRAAAIGSPAYTWGRSLQGSGGGLRILQRFRRPLYTRGLDRAGTCACHKRGDTPTNVGSYTSK